MNQNLNIHDVEKIVVRSVKKLTITDDLKTCREVFSKAFYFIDSKGNEVEVTAFGKFEDSLRIINKIKLTR